jgi:hypothetical protein
VFGTGSRASTHNQGTRFREGLARAVGLVAAGCAVVESADQGTTQACGLSLARWSARGTRFRLAVPTLAGSVRLAVIRFAQQASKSPMPAAVWLLQVETRADYVIVS